MYSFEPKPGVGQSQESIPEPQKEVIPVKRLDIVIPSDFSLPDLDKYPSLLDIQNAIAQAEKEAKWITGESNQQEHKKVVGYLRNLLNNSPEQQKIDTANREAGPNVSFSKEQVSFLDGFKEEMHMSVRENFRDIFNVFRESLEQEGKASSLYPMAGPSFGISNVNYIRDLIAFTEREYAHLGEPISEEFIQLKTKFEDLFPVKDNEKGV